MGAKNIVLRLDSGKNFPVRLVYTNVLNLMNACVLWNLLIEFFQIRGLSMCSNSESLQIGVFLTRQLTDIF